MNILPLLFLYLAYQAEKDFSDDYSCVPVRMWGKGYSPTFIFTVVKVFFLTLLSIAVLFSVITFVVGWNVAKPMWLVALFMSPATLAFVACGVLSGGPPDRSFQTTQRGQ